jgi:hypothetical protein
MVFNLASSKGMASGDMEDIGLMGPVEDLSEEALAQTFFFPAELIGGSCPQVKGEEEMLAWNAAAEACDSERIHFVWRAHEERVWYLAVRSSDLASHPHSWCPFASLLPGMPDANLPPVIYTYYSDEAAILMAVEKDSLHIIRSTSSVIKAKAERLSREMGNADTVDLIPDTIVKLKAKGWNSLSLLENRARRFFALASVLSALTIILASFFIWFSATVSQLAYKANLNELQARTNAAVMQLQQTAMELRTSGLREQIANFNTLNESLVNIEGWLKRYSYENNQVKWWAIVPQNLTSDRIQELKAQTIETSPEGLIIANSKASVIRKNQK